MSEESRKVKLYCVRQPVNTLPINDLVWCLAVHERTLYSGSNSGVVCEWDATTGKAKRRFQVSNDAVRSIAITPVGIICCADNVLVKLNMLDGSVQQLSHDIGKQPVSLWAEWPSIYAGYQDGTLRHWLDGECVAEYPGQSDAIMTVAKAGHAFYCGSRDGTIWRHSTASGRSFAIYKGFHGPVRAVLIWEKFVVAGTGPIVRVQDIESGSVKAKLALHKEPVYSLLRDRRILYSASSEQIVIVWNLKTMSAMMVVNSGHQSVVKCMALSYFGMLFTGSADRTIKQWDMQEAFAHVTGKGGRAKPAATQEKKKTGLFGRSSNAKEQSRDMTSTESNALNEWMAQAANLADKELRAIEEEKRNIDQQKAAKITERQSHGAAPTSSSNPPMSGSSGSGGPSAVAHTSAGKASTPVMKKRLSAQMAQQTARKGSIPSYNQQVIQEVEDSVGFIDEENPYHNRGAEAADNLGGVIGDWQNQLYEKN